MNIFCHFFHTTDNVKENFNKQLQLKWLISIHIDVFQLKWVSKTSMNEVPHFEKTQIIVKSV